MPENIVIDQQHDELFRKFRQLTHAVINGKPRESLERLIDEIISHTRFHLEYEEQLMDRSEFPDLEWHKKKHKELLDDVLKFKEKLRYVGEERFVEWLNHWPLGRLKAHIEYSDKPAENFIKNQGMKK